MSSVSSNSPRIQYNPLPSNPAPEPYKFSGEQKTEVLDGKKFRARHNVNSQGQHTQIHSSKFQRVRPTEAEFKDAVGQYKDIVTLSTDKGTHVAKLKANEKPEIGSKSWAKDRGEKKALEGFETTFHDRFRNEMSTPQAPANRGFFSKIWDRLTGEEEKIQLTKSDNGDGKFTVGIKTTKSQPTGDNLSVTPLEEGKDKSLGQKVGYALLGLGILAGAVALGVAAPIIMGAGALFIGLGAAGGALTLGVVAKFCSNIKSPWWAKTVDGQRQWEERKSAVQVGNGIEQMVRNQVLSGVAAGEGNAFNPTDEATFKDPQLCKPETLVEWMKLLKHNSPDELKAKIKEELLDPDKSFLHEKTIKDAKRGAHEGWWFTGNPKGHAKKTVNIVADEIYKGVVRGVASGYMQLIETELADAKTEKAQKELKPWLLKTTDEFKAALNLYKPAQEAARPTEESLESNAYEFYETDQARGKIQGYRSQKAALAESLEGKKAFIGDVNYDVYTEVLKSFDHDLETYEGSLSVVDRIINGPAQEMDEGETAPASIQDVNSGLGSILDLYLSSSEESGNAEENPLDRLNGLANRLENNIVQIKELITSEVREESESPVLLKQHHDGLIELAGKYSGENGAISNVATFTRTLISADQTLRGEGLTRDSIGSQLKSLEELRKISPADACPMKTDTGLLGNIARAEKGRNVMVNKIESLQTAYCNLDKALSLSSLLREASQEDLGKALGSEKYIEFSKLIDAAVRGLDLWKDVESGKPYGTPTDLNPEKVLASVRRGMVAAALQLPQETDLEELSFALDALCVQDREAVITALKQLEPEMKVALLKELQAIHLSDDAESVKACRSFEQVCKTFSTEKASEAASLAKTLYTDQTSTLEKFRLYTTIIGNLAKASERHSATLDAWTKLQASNSGENNPQGFIDNLLTFIISVNNSDPKETFGKDLQSLKELKSQIDSIGESDLAQKAGQIGGLDQQTLGELGELTARLAGEKSPYTEAIQESIRSLTAQRNVLSKQIAGVVGGSDHTEVQEAIARAASSNNQEQQDAAGELLVKVGNQIDGTLQDLGIAQISAKEAVQALKQLLKSNLTDEQMTLKLAENIELSTLLQLGIASEAELDGRVGIPELAHRFTPNELKQGLRTFAESTVIPGEHHSDDETKYLTKRNKIIKAVKKELDKIDKGKSENQEKQLVKLADKYRSAIETFLHEEKAYQALSSLYSNGTVTPKQLRGLFEKHSPDYMQSRNSLNRNLGTHELLSEQHLNELDSKLQENLKCQAEVLKKLQNAGDTGSIWRNSPYLKGVESHLIGLRGDINKTKSAFENAAKGGLAEFGQRLNETEIGRNIDPTKIRLAYLKGQSEAVKKGLKYLNPKTMEIVRPGIFRRIYNKLFSPTTRYEKLLTAQDITNFQGKIRELCVSQNTKKYLLGTLDDLKETQELLTEHRNSLTNSPEKVALALHMIAIEQLASLATTDPNAKLTGHDFKAIVDKWKSHLGASSGNFADIVKSLKEQIVGKSITELESQLTPELQEEFRKDLTSLQIHQQDVVQAHDLLMAKLDAAENLLTYKEMTKEDLRNTELFAKGGDVTKKPSWLQKSDTSFKSNEINDKTGMVHVLYRMTDLIDNSSNNNLSDKKILKESLNTLLQSFGKVQAMHQLAMSSLEVESIDELSQNLEALKPDEVLNDLNKTLKDFETLKNKDFGTNSPTESLRERILNGYENQASALDMIVSRLKNEIGKIGTLKQSLSAKMEITKLNQEELETVIDADNEDLDPQAMRNADIDYIMDEISKYEPSNRQILEGLNDAEIERFQMAVINATTPEEKETLLAKIRQLNPQNPAAQSSAASATAQQSEAQVVEQSGALPANPDLQSMSNLTYKEFGSDTERGKVQNGIWNKLSEVQKNNLGFAKDYVHAPVEAGGYCLLTALASVNNMSTSELQKKIEDTINQSGNEGLKKNWEEEKLKSRGQSRDDIGSKGLDPHALAAVFAAVGIKFNIVSSRAGLYGIQGIAGDPVERDPTLFHSDTGGTGHFDLLIPRNVAIDNNVPTDGSLYIAKK